MRILVVEDDDIAAEYVRKGLMEAGHVVDLAPDGELGLEMAKAADYDALVLDRMLPKRDGGSWRRISLAGLALLGEVDQKVEGLRAGGDDYLAKPYSFTELLARVEAIGRRSDPTAAVTKLKAGDLEMDLLARTVKRGGQNILLQPREFRLLECLMRHAGKVVTRTMLLEKVGSWRRISLAGLALLGENPDYAHASKTAPQEYSLSAVDDRCGNVCSIIIGCAWLYLFRDCYIRFEQHRRRHAR